MNLSKCIYFPSLSLLSLLSQLSWRFFWSQDLISRASPISHLSSHASCYYRPGWNELRWRTLYLDSHRTTLNPCCQCKHEVWCSWETSSEQTEYAGPRVSGPHWRGSLTPHVSEMHWHWHLTLCIKFQQIKHFHFYKGLLVQINKK